MKRSLVVLILTLLGASGVAAEEAPRRITLEEALALAQRQSIAVTHASSRVLELDRHARAERARYLPSVTIEANLVRSTDPFSISFPTGSLGTVPGTGEPLPPAEVRIDQGATSTAYGLVTVAQPITQLFKVGQSYGAARADADAGKADLLRARGDVAKETIRLYYSLLAASRRREAARLGLLAAEARAGRLETSVKAGVSLPVAGVEAQTALLSARSNLLEAENDVADFEFDLNDLLGFPLDNQFEPVTPPSPSAAAPMVADATAEALRSNPDVRSARAMVHKAACGVRAAWANYVPDVSLYGQYVAQDGVSFLPTDNVMVGLKAEWTVFDFGRREFDIGASQATLDQANQGLRRAENHARGDVERVARKLSRARVALEAAQNALAQRTEAARLEADHARAGLILAENASDAAAAEAQAESEVIQAEMGVRIALAELDQAIGRAPQ